MKLFFKLVSLLFLVVSYSPIWAGSCIDPPDGSGGQMRTCHVGPSAWVAYHTDDDALWDSTACNNTICSCGDANDSDPCDGCGKISLWNASSCHATGGVNCTVPCTPVPELPETSHALMQIIFFGSVIGFITLQKLKASKTEPT